MLGIETKLSTAYYPQTDVQIERINQELKQYLRIYVDHRQNNWLECVVATTRHKVQQLHKQVKLSVGNQVGKITRELNKESLLNQGPIYIKSSWSMLLIINPTLMSMLLPYVHLKATILYTCALILSSRFFYYILGLGHHIMWHVM